MLARLIPIHAMLPMELRLVLLKAYRGQSKGSEDKKLKEK
jgi:hypothetical protein